MATKLLLGGYCPRLKPLSPAPPTLSRYQSTIHLATRSFNPLCPNSSRLLQRAKNRFPVAVSAAMQPLDLTEENVEQVLVDARTELAQLFDTSVGITGQAELADLDGPFIKLRLRGKFWHTRAMVVARLENYLKQRIPEILEVDIEDEKQLDDSPANF